MTQIAFNAGFAARLVFRTGTLAKKRLSSKVWVMALGPRGSYVAGSRQSQETRAHETKLPEVTNRPRRDRRPTSAVSARSDMHLPGQPGRQAAAEGFGRAPKQAAVTVPRLRHDLLLDLAGCGLGLPPQAVAQGRS